MKAALIQLRVSDNETSAERWLRVERIFAQLESEAIDLIVLPELWGVGYGNYAAYREEAEPLQGLTVSRLTPWARRLRSHILTGSFIERATDRKHYNTSVMLDANGFMLGKYRKIHLFGYESEERRLLAAGRHTSEVYTPFGIVGLATCYDLRFPEQFRRMVDNGATMFAVAAAWPEIRLEDWRMLCRVRALENQSFLLACNHTGTWDGVSGAGHSMIVAPDGSVIAEAGADEQVLIADLDMNDAQRYRIQFPPLHDRVKIE